MNSWQMAQQLRKELQVATWPTGSAELVFGIDRVFVLVDEPTDEQIPPTFPWCMIVFGTGIPDDDDPALLTQTYSLLAAANVTGDPMGEHAITGGPVSDLGESGSRGVAEISERVRVAVQSLTGADGAPIIVSLSGAGGMTPLGQGLHLVYDEHSVSALCTSALHYSAPQIIAHDGSDWTWEGAHASDRFDFVQYRLFSKVGTSPSTSPSDAGNTLIYTGVAAATTAVATSGLTYTVFADYSARDPDQSIPASSIDGSSDPEVGSFLVVV